MREALKTYHMCDGLQGLARILDQRFRPSPALLDQKSENGRAVQFLEAILQFELVGPHLMGEFL